MARCRTGLPSLRYKYLDDDYSDDGSSGEEVCHNCGSGGDLIDGFCESCINDQEIMFESVPSLTPSERLDRELSSFQKTRKIECKNIIKADPRNKGYLLNHKIKKRKANGIENAQNAYLLGQKSLIILEEIWLDIFHKGLVRPCLKCKEFCPHLSGEDHEFLLFWRMRSVSAQWKETIDGWFAKKKFILTIGEFSILGTWVKSEHLVNKFHNVKYPFSQHNAKILVTARNCPVLKLCPCFLSPWKEFAMRVAKEYKFIKTLPINC